ncbi:MAG: hypothetical protein FWD91_08370 [Treponema sp.]|nr:hypothetical protein [Treponema sp.]
MRLVSGGTWIAVGLDGYTAHSTDGENWTVTQVGANSWWGVAFCGE